MCVDAMGDLYLLLLGGNVLRLNVRKHVNNTNKVTVEKWEGNTDNSNVSNNTVVLLLPPVATQVDNRNLVQYATEDLLLGKDTEV